MSKIQIVLTTIASALVLVGVPLLLAIAHHIKLRRARSLVIPALLALESENEPYQEGKWVLSKDLRELLASQGASLSGPHLSLLMVKLEEEGLVESYQEPHVSDGITYKKWYFRIKIHED